MQKGFVHPNLGWFPLLIANTVRKDIVGLYNLGAGHSQLATELVVSACRFGRITEGRSWQREPAELRQRGQVNWGT